LSGLLRKRGPAKPPAHFMQRVGGCPCGSQIPDRRVVTGLASAIRL
jgi:hypothetical protein